MAQVQVPAVIVMLHNNWHRRLSQVVTAIRNKQFAEAADLVDCLVTDVRADLEVNTDHWHESEALSLQAHVDQLRGEGQRFVSRVSELGAYQRQIAQSFADRAAHNYAMAGITLLSSRSDDPEVLKSAYELIEESLALSGFSRRSSSVIREALELMEKSMSEEES